MTDLSRRSDALSRQSAEGAAAEVAKAERDLREALTVDPSPQFAARVRARIADEPARVERRFGLRTWMPIAAGAFAALALAVALWPSRAPIAAPSPQKLPGRSVVAAAMLPAATPSAVRRAEPAVRPVGALTPGAPGSGEPEVLISPSESRAILNLIAGIRTGRIDPSSLPAAPPPIVDLDIQPIVIAPLTTVDGAEGVRQ